MAYSPKNPNGQATMANSEPIVIASDQTSIPVTVSGVATAANQTTGNTSLATIAGAVAGTEMQVDVLTLPSTQFADIAITGQGSQTALNQNVILASAGTSSYDTLGTTGIAYRSISISITPAAGTVTAGVVTFEGSNDNTNFVPFFVTDEANITASPVVSYGVTASTTRYFKAPVLWRYIRARISTGITGTTTGIQAFTRLSTEPFSDNTINVKQATAASLNVNVGTIATSVTPGTAAANLGKARDAVAGASDTGIAHYYVRRDTPTAVTPTAGDYEIAQISANGEQWVRLQGEIADDAAFTVGTTRVLPSGLLADETSPDSVDEGDIGIARMTLDRKAIGTLYPSSTTGDGLSVRNFNSGDTFTALTNSAQVIKASAGNLYGYYIYNPNATEVYVMLYNVAAASVTVGTTTPQMVFCIPATNGANLMFPYPIPFTNAGWSIAAATTGGGNGAPTTALEAMIFYR